MTDLLDTALNDLVPTFADEQPDWNDVLARSADAVTRGRRLPGGGIRGVRWPSRSRSS